MGERGEEAGSERRVGQPAHVRSESRSRGASGGPLSAPPLTPLSPPPPFVSVLEWLESYAAAHGLKWRRDSLNNTVIYRPGSGGGESAPPVIIQGHVDVVTEKNDDTTHDFFTQGVSLLREGDWVTADGTTLGADNGIGVAAALALLAAPPSASLPPLEVLLTTDEEAGMGGAMGLDGGMLSGRTLLNLDTEEWGEIYIGCAGGGDSRLLLDVPLEPVPPGLAFLSLRVVGLLGGHSGMNIGEGRGNAVRLLARALDAAGLEAPLALAAAGGGDKRNAIAREASAAFGVPAAAKPAVLEALRRVEREAKEEFGTLETGLRFEIDDLAPDAAPAAAFAPDAAARLVTLLLALPHGPIKYSHAVEGLVETSNNVASLKTLSKEDVEAVQGKKGETVDLATSSEAPPPPSSSSSAAAAFSPSALGESHVVLDVTCSTRSSVDPALTAARRAIARLGALAGARVLQESRYPGWAPTPEAPVIKAAARALRAVTGREPGLKAIHAGLECGLLREKIPGVQCVSYGPTITGAHSPDEKVQISTVEPFFKATAILLEQLAKVKA